MGDPLERVDVLLQRRNAIDADLAAIMDRPMTSGHLGEWIAARVFDIDLQTSASAAAIDGRFSSGAVAGRMVNVKWYLKREGVLDITESEALDYYLLLTGPPSGPALRAARPGRGALMRCTCSARMLRSEQISRGVKLGIASSVTARQWEAAEVYPLAANPILWVSSSQRALLELFRTT